MFVEICFVFGVLSILQFTNASVPDECKNLNYCTIKPDDYPQELFNSMFKGKFQEPVFQPTLVTSESEARQADEEGGNCKSRVEFEPIYSVKNKKGEWNTVVQAPEENYSQKVRIESCEESGSPCFTQLEGHIELSTPSCQQKYNEWEFLIQDGESANTTTTKVVLPVCCSCFYKSTF